MVLSAVLRALIRSYAFQLFEDERKEDFIDRKYIQHIMRIISSIFSSLVCRQKVRRSR